MKFLSSALVVALAAPALAFVSPNAAHTATSSSLAQSTAQLTASSALQMVAAEIGSETRKRTREVSLIYFLPLAA